MLGLSSGTIKVVEFTPPTYVPPPTEDADIIAPTIVITSPAASATVTGSVSITATATDNRRVVGVVFKLDGDSLGSEQTSAPYAASFDSTTRLNGTHVISVTARDAAGNATTETVSIVVDNYIPDVSPPTVALTSPSAGATVAGTITLSATASDNTGVVGVQFKVDGVNVGAVITSAPFTLLLDTTTLSEGSHVVSALVWDAAENASTASRSFTVQNAVPFQFTATTYTESSRTVAGSTSTSTVKDRVEQIITTDRVFRDSQIDVTYTGSLPSAITWTSSNPAVATVSSTGFVTHLTSGYTQITASVSTGQSVSRGLNLTAEGGSTTTVLSYAEGSLRRTLLDEMEAMCVARGFNATAKETYNPKNISTHVYTRNADCWTYPLNVAHRTVWTSYGDSPSSMLESRGAQVISPQHLIGAAHWFPLGTTQVKIVGADGTVHTRQIIGTRSITGGFASGDIMVGRLSSDLPTTGPSAVTISKVLPANWRAYLPDLSSVHPVPAVCYRQYSLVVTSDWAGSGTYESFTQAPASRPATRALYEPKISGDSGSGAYLYINGTPVVLCSWTYGGGGSGGSVQYWKSEINAMLTSLGGGHQLTEIDLSAYPTYS